MPVVSVSIRTKTLYDLETVAEAYARFKASGKKAIPAERVYEELGL